MMILLARRTVRTALTLLFIVSLVTNASLAPAPRVASAASSKKIQPASVNPTPAASLSPVSSTPPASPNTAPKNKKADIALPSDLPGVGGSSILLLPSAETRPAYDKIWRSVGNGWVGISPPAMGVVWQGLVADPFDADRWFLYARNNFWLTTNAGSTWSAVTLSGATGTIGGTGGDFQFLAEWSTVTPGKLLVFAWVQDSTFTGALYFWQGSPSSMTATLISGSYFDRYTYGMTPGATADETLLNARLDASTYFAGYIQGTSPVAVTQTTTPLVLFLERMAGASHAIVAARYSAFHGSIWVTDDYQTDSFREVSGLGNGSIDSGDLHGARNFLASTLSGTVYLGRRTNGILKVTNIFGTPQSQVVVNDSIGYIRSDRQQRTSVAALRKVINDKDVPGIVYLLEDEGQSWQTLNRPFATLTEPVKLAPAIEIIRSGERLAEDQQRIPENCVCDPSVNSHTHRPVNTRTGNYWTQVHDIEVQTPGPALSWQRSYSSQAITETTSTLGYGWQHTFATRLGSGTF